MTRISLIICGLASLLGLASSSSAQTNYFYTIDANTDRLMIVDTSGNVSAADPNGPGLGFNMVNPDLAWHQGTLYAADKGNLYTIAMNGAATQVGFLRLGLLTMEAESLASDGTNLYAGFGTPSSNLSTIWGQCSTNGSLTAIQGMTDVDGAGFGGGTFWHIDLFMQLDQTSNYLYNGYPAPVNYASHHSSNAPGGAAMDENDLGASIGNSIFCISSSTNMITEYSKSTGLLSNVTNLNQTGNYRGLETAPVPEPASLLAIGIGMLGLLRRSRMTKQGRSSVRP